MLWISLQSCLDVACLRVQLYLFVNIVRWISVMFGGFTFPLHMLLGTCRFNIFRLFNPFWCLCFFLLNNQTEGIVCADLKTAQNGAPKKYQSMANRQRSARAVPLRPRPIATLPICLRLNWVLRCWRRPTGHSSKNCLKLVRIPFFAHPIHSIVDFVVKIGLQKQNEAYASGENGHRSHCARLERRSVSHRSGREYDDRVAVRSTGKGLVTRFNQQARQIGALVALTILLGHSRQHTSAERHWHKLFDARYVHVQLTFQLDFSFRLFFVQKAVAWSAMRKRMDCTWNVLFNIHCVCLSVLCLISIISIYHIAFWKLFGAFHWFWLLYSIKAHSSPVYRLHVWFVRCRLSGGGECLFIDSFTFRFVFTCHREWITTQPRQRTIQITWSKRLNAGSTTSFTRFTRVRYQVSVFYQSIFYIVSFIFYEANVHI